ncbi:MAG TPA: class I SAM-dependent methyltransferase [Verrucomicrobiae bacterium]|nr:class I SAM-dependent methyltransferase [Verrucomicrobiae bacterium]
MTNMPLETGDEPTKRAQAESRFYDRYAEHLSPERLAPQEVFAPTCRENLYVLEQLGDLRGKRVLDIGCGQGDTSVFFALGGAEVHALDVSERMVAITNELARHHGVGERISAQVCRVEDMKYTDDYFDLVFADGVLHHLDMPQAVPSIVRVMKPGGRGIFLEPQRGSIFSEIYRLFATDLRTENEHPLEQRDFDFLAGQFGRLSHREFHLVSLVLFAMRFASLKLSGQAFPYWMDEVRQGQYHPKLLRRLQSVDEWVFRHFPALRKYTWLTVIVAEKPKG